VTYDPARDISATADTGCGDYGKAVPSISVSPRPSTLRSPTTGVSVMPEALQTM
jgi:hypothetical protein